MLLLINDQLYDISCVGWHHHSHSCWAAPPQQGIFIPWDSNLRFPSLTLISVVCCFQGKGWKMHVMWGLFHTGLFSVRSYMDFELGLRPGWPEVRTIFAHVLHVKQSWRPVSSAQYENWEHWVHLQKACALHAWQLADVRMLLVGAFDSFIV